MKGLFFFIYFLATALGTLRASEADSVRISLLTCGAGEEIYSLFGHTALRYENPARGVDVVYNYGVFSFNTPNFALRFALGETDYQLGRTTYERFAAAYAWEGRDVRQQTLNLRPEEQLRLVEQLEENYRPQNRIYRYNFFYDNCATRPRDKVESAVEGEVVYAEEMDSTNTGKTYRDLLHQYTEGAPWSRFGIDLCIGSPADRSISRRQMMFIPFYVEEFFATARICTTAGEERPLVSDTAWPIRIEDDERPEPFDGITPLQASLLLLAIILLLTAYGWWKRKSLWGIDALLFAVAGIAGSILAFLAGLSQHPAVSPNYLLFVLHPFHLLILPFTIQKLRKGKKSLYMIANLAVLTFFIALWKVIPQEFDVAVLPLTLCLWIRSANNIYMYKYRKG